MFDMEHQRRLEAGQNPDKALLVTFRYEYDDKRGEQIPYVNIFMSKNTTVDRPATDDDFKRFPDRWEAFLKNEDAPPDGLPINHIPFANPAEISICKAERIYTAEQLVETPDSRLQRPGLLNFKARVSDMLKQLKDSKHVADMREEMDKLKSQMEALIETNASLKQELAEAQTKRQPRKKASGDSSGDS